jgi:hypothetical protein
MNGKQTLLDKIDRRDAPIAVIGLGYVVLPLAVAFAGAGFRTAGIDVDGRKAADVNAGECDIGSVPANALGADLAAGCAPPPTLRRWSIAMRWPSARPTRSPRPTTRT